jgi:hypothetical protein
MAFKKRRDGIYLKKLPAFRRIFPYLMPTRDESVIFANQKIGVDRLLDWLEKLNRGREKSERISFFHCVLTAAARVLRLRPQLNRFVAGKRIYRHKDITITFIVKKAMTEEADESEARVVFTGEETLAEVRDKVNGHIERARGAEKGSDDKLIEFVGGLPRPILNFVDRLFRWLDYHNLMLGFLMETIPLYTSVYLANLGSINLNAVYHHLYEYGTASTFAVIGKIHKEPWVDERDRISVRRCVEMSFTLDERVSEGFYYARSIALLTALLEHPELLDRPELDADEIFSAAEGGVKRKPARPRKGAKKPGTKTGRRLR